MEGPCWDRGGEVKEPCWDRGGSGDCLAGIEVGRVLEGKLVLK